MQGGECRMRVLSCHFTDHSHDLYLMPEVQVIGGFVQQHNSRLLDQ